MNAVDKNRLAELMSVPAEVQREIELFIALEAELLDSAQYDVWLELFTDDCEYLCDINDKSFPEEQREGFKQGYGGRLFWEDKPTMRIRVGQKMCGRDVSERPKSILRHMATNFRVSPTGNPDEYKVLSNFLVNRLRDDDRVDTYCGENEHVIRRADNFMGWEISRRNIKLDQTVILGGGIGFFF